LLDFKLELEICSGALKSQAHKLMGWFSGPATNRRDPLAPALIRVLNYPCLIKYLSVDDSLIRLLHKGARKKLIFLRERPKWPITISISSDFKVKRMTCSN
jgi:hypothetical protein